MTTPEPRAGGTRGLLLDAAIAVMADDGWAAATSRVVAERAGVNNALVHYYFGSIDALRRAAVMYAIERELEGPVAAILQADNVLDGIVAAMSGLAAGEPGAPGQRVMTEALVQCVRDETLRADIAGQLRNFRELLAGRFAENQAAGLLRADADPHALAVAFTALLDGLLLHMFADPGLDARAPTEALIELLRPSAQGAHAVRRRRSRAPTHPGQDAAAERRRPR